MYYLSLITFINELIELMQYQKRRTLGKFPFLDLKYFNCFSYIINKIFTFLIRFKYCKSF